VGDEGGILITVKLGVCSGPLGGSSTIFEDAWRYT